MMEKENALDQKRLSFAAGITVTLIVATFSLAHSISESAAVSFLYNSSEAWKEYLPLTLNGLMLLASIALLFSCYLILNALSLSSSNLMPTKIPAILNFLWNLSMFLLLVFFLVLILFGLEFGISAFHNRVLRWIFFALLALPLTGGLSLLLSLFRKLLRRIRPARVMPSRVLSLFRKLLRRIRPAWVMPSWVSFVLIYFLVLINVSYAIAPTRKFFLLRIISLPAKQL